MKRLGLLLAHPLHAVLSDFPITLLVCGLVCDSVGWWSDDPFFWRAGFYAGLAAMALVLPMAATGLWELRKIAHSPHLGLALWHLSLMLTAASIYGLMLLLRGTSAPAVTVLAEAIAVLVMLAGAWCGGHLVFGHGVGVSRKSW